MVGKGKRGECRATPGTPYFGRWCKVEKVALFASHREIYFVETCLNLRFNSKLCARQQNIQHFCTTQHRLILFFQFLENIP